MEQDSDSEAQRIIQSWKRQRDSINPRPMVIVERKSKKVKKSVEQQLEQLQQEYNAFQGQEQLFSVLEIGSQQNYRIYHSKILQWVLHYAENQIQKEFDQLKNNNEINKNSLKDIDRRYQQKLRIKLVELYRQMKNKKLIQDSYQTFWKYFNSNLIVTSVKFSDLPQDQHEMVVNQGARRVSIPASYIIVPKINFITFLHGLKSVKLQFFFSYQPSYQIRRLKQYLALVRYENFISYDERMRLNNSVYYQKQRVIEAFSKIYSVPKSFFTKDFTKNSRSTILFEAVYSFQQSSTKRLAILIQKEVLNLFVVSRKDVYYQPLPIPFGDEDFSQWSQQDQKQFLQLITKFASLKNYQQQWVRYYTIVKLVVEKLASLDMSYVLPERQIAEIPLNKKKVQQSFTRFRALARKRFYAQMNLRKSQKNGFDQIQQQQQFDVHQSVFYTLIKIVAIGIVSKMSQYLEIGKTFQHFRQTDFGRLHSPKNFEWTVFMEFKLKQEENQTIVRISKKIEIKKEKILNARQNEQQVITEIIYSIYDEIVAQFRERNTYYHQLWTENPFLQIQITKIEAISRQIRPILNTLMIQQQQTWLWGIIFYTSSLHSYFWRSRNFQLVSYKKVWTVYSHSLEMAQSFISAFQRQRGIKIKAFNCFMRILIVLNEYKENFLNKDLDKDYGSFCDQLARQDQIFGYIFKNHDIYNLCHYFGVNLCFIRKDLSHLNIQSYQYQKYCVYVYNTHAQIQFNRIIPTMKQRTLSNSSLVKVKGRMLDTSKVVQRFRPVLQNDYKQFCKSYIKTNFAYIDLQTYAIKDQVMPIYLAVLVLYLPEQIRLFLENNYGFQQNSQFIQSWRKCTLSITKQSLQFEWFNKKCSSIKQLCAWIMCASADLHYQVFQQPLFWWTFNGLKFDYLFMLRQLVNFGAKYDSYGIGRQCKGMRNQIIVLQDARNFFPSGSLKSLTHENNSIFKKKDLDIGLIKTEEEFLAKKQQIVDYCKFDCYSLEQLITKFYENLYKMVIHAFINYTAKKSPDRIGDNIKFSKLVERPTASNISLYFFRLLFLKNDYVVPDSKQQIQEQKTSFSGGMVQVFRHYIRKDEKIYEADANAMYPSNMKYLPIHQYADKWWKQCQSHQQFKTLFMQRTNNFELLKEFLFENEVQNYLLRDQFREINYQPSQVQFYNAITNRYLLKFINLGDKVTPYIAKRQNQCLWYSKNIRVKRWVSGQALLFLMANKCSFQIEKVRLRSSYLLGKYENPFYEFSTLCYKQRAKYKKSGQTGLADCFKLMMNSLYGKFLQQRFRKITLQHPGLSQQEAMIMAIRQCEQFIYNEEQDQGQLGNFSGDLISIASTITQLSRVKISQIINQVGKQNVLYGDTDSVYFNQQGKKRFELLKLNFRNRDWDGDGETQSKFIAGQSLGQWKIQNPKSPFVKGVFISRKCLILKNDEFFSKKHDKIITPQDRKQLREIFIDEMKSKKQFKDIEEQRICFVLWKRDKFYKVRLKGINFKPTGQECQIIIQAALNSYHQALKTFSFSADNFPVKIPIPLNFKTDVWKKQVFEKDKGVKRIDGQKSISFNLKRIPFPDGQTAPINGFGIFPLQKFEK